MFIIEVLNSELEILIEKNEIFKKEINNEFYEYEKLKEDFFKVLSMLICKSLI